MSAKSQVVNCNVHTTTERQYWVEMMEILRPLGMTRRWYMAIQTYLFEKEKKIKIRIRPTHDLHLNFFR